ncbi:MAG: AraC family transcriptional regulator [Bacteroidota bacterium]
MPNYAAFISGLVIFLFLFFSGFLFFYPKGQRNSRYLLATLFLVLGLAVADVFLLISGTYLQFPRFAFWLNQLPFLYGPIVWWLTLSVTRPKFQPKWKDYLHFLPFALGFITFIFLYHIRDSDYQQEFIRRSLEAPGDEANLSSFLLIGLIGVYLFFSYRRIQRYRQDIKKEVSNVEHINLGWLRLTIIGFAIIMVLSLVINVAKVFVENAEILNVLLLTTLFGMLIFIMVAIVRGLTTDTVFAAELMEMPSAAVPIVLLEIDINQLNRLQDYMQTERPYLNPSLSLKELSTALSMSSRELSTLINRGTHQSFFDFINSYRIQYAKDKIRKATDEKMTILEVMYDSGFNSKSSFNTAFKKHSGYTPTQWKKLSI